MNPFKGLIALLGRLCLAAIFLGSTFMNKIPNFNSVVEQMAAQGIPEPRIMLMGAIAFLIVGSTLVILGLWARFGATLLLIFLGLAAYYFHDFWTMRGAEAQEQQIHFMKNLAMMGAMLLIIANGPGPMSVDHSRAKRKAAQG